MPEQKRVINLATDSNGAYFCSIPVSKEQWLEILRNKTVTSPSMMRVLLSFYFMPGHKASCFQCAQEYGNTINFYNTGISSFGRAVAKHLDDFEIIDESGDVRYWPIPVGKGREVKLKGKDQFEWQLRDGLAEALEEIVIDNAISSYIVDFDKYWDDEKYKWRAVEWFQEKWDIDAPDFPAMLDDATSRSENLLGSRNTYPRGMIVEMAKADTPAVKEMFANLYDETLPLEKRVADFIKRADEIRKKHNPGSWNMHYQSTNSVSVYLWLRYPDKYYIYKYGEYREVDEKLGLGYVFKRNGEPTEMAKGFEMYGVLNDALSRNTEVKDTIASHLAEDSSLYSDPELKTATTDLGYYISRRYKSIKASLYSKSTSSMNPFISTSKKIIYAKKNIIRP